MSNFELFKEPNVIFAKRAPGMMFGLILDVTDCGRDLRVATGNGVNPRLPAKPAANPPFAIDEVGRTVLEVPHQVRKSHAGSESYQHMRVVRHAIYGQQLLISLGRNARQLLLKLFLELGADEVLASFHGKNDLDVDLGVGVGHGLSIERRSLTGQTCCRGCHRRLG